MPVLSRIRLFGLVSMFSLAIVVTLSCREDLEAGEEAGEAAASAALAPAATNTGGDLAVADAAPLTDVEPTLTIVYTNNIDGEIEPCG